MPCPIIAPCAQLLCGWNGPLWHLLCQNSAVGSGCNDMRRCFRGVGFHTLWTWTASPLGLVTVLEYDKCFIRVACVPGKGIWSGLSEAQCRGWDPSVAHHCFLGSRCRKFSRRLIFSSQQVPLKLAFAFVELEGLLGPETGKNCGRRSQDKVRLPKHSLWGRGMFAMRLRLLLKINKNASRVTLAWSDLFLSAQEEPDVNQAVPDVEQVDCRLGRYPQDVTESEERKEPEPQCGDFLGLHKVASITSLPCLSEIAGAAGKMKTMAGGLQVPLLGFFSLSALIVFFSFFHPTISKYDDLEEASFVGGRVLDCTPCLETVVNALQRRSNGVQGGATLWAHSCSVLECSPWPLAWSKA